MTTLSFDRFGPTPGGPRDAGLLTDTEIDEEVELQRVRDELVDEYGEVFQEILEAFESAYGWDGMPDCVKEVGEELGLI